MLFRENASTLNTGISRSDVKTSGFTNESASKPRSRGGPSSFVPK